MNQKQIISILIGTFILIVIIIIPLSNHSTIKFNEIGDYISNNSIEWLQVIGTCLIDLILIVLCYHVFKDENAK
jgi:hypothetical protein